MSNYTHRVAISNRRIVAVDQTQRTVSIRYRDYRDTSKNKLLTLSAREFIRRFCLHILPHKLVRIRHYGILGNNRRKRDIAAARNILARQAQRRGTGNLVSSVSSAQHNPAPAPLTCPFCEVPLRFAAIRDRQGVIQFIGRSPVPYHDSS
jgi:hypothetical protein